VLCFVACFKDAAVKVCEGGRKGGRKRERYRALLWPALRTLFRCEREAGGQRE
jgi:hypothetical protein